MTTWRTISALLAASWLLAAGMVGGGEVVDIDNVPHIRNGREPAQGDVTYRLEELWRVGGQDDDTIFSFILDVITDPSGNVYLLDADLCQVFVYSPAGDLVRTLSREGEGPGELREPTALLLMPDGQLGIVRFNPGRIVIMTLDGVPAGDILVGQRDPEEGGMFVARSARCRGGRLVFAGEGIRPIPGGQQDVHYLSYFSFEGREEARLLEKAIDYDHSKIEFLESRNYFPDREAWDLGPEGCLYVVEERNRYAVTVYSPDGSLNRVIEKEHTLVRRPRDRIEEMQRDFEDLGRKYGREPQLEIEKSYSAIRMVRVDDEGQLWIRPSVDQEQQPDSLLSSFDLFDIDGDFTKRVHFVCSGPCYRGRLFFIGAERVVLVTEFVTRSEDKEDLETEQPPGAICYALVKT